MSWPHDPELPAGYQDADLEQAELERAAEERPVSVPEEELRTWSVTLKGWGHVSTRTIVAPSRREAEEKALDQIGFSIEAEETGR